MKKESEKLPPTTTRTNPDLSKMLVSIHAASDLVQIRIENFLKQNYQFRYNEVTCRIEFKKKSGTEFQEMSDYQCNSIIRQVVASGIPCSSTMLRTIINSDFAVSYNPFKAYFDGLPEYDGQIDYIGQLAEQVNTTNNELWHYCLKKWLVAMVGSLVDDEKINHTVIVLSGSQGVGKTTWVLNLVPKELKKYCFSGMVNPNNKDTLTQISECMLINMDELENLNRSEIGSLKELITKSGIRVRRAYGYHAETLVRRASFIGSVNGKEFLSDTTGSRRFLCFEVIQIDYGSTMPMDWIYAQALDLYRNGYQYWFDATETEKITQNNEQFRTSSVEEELLQKYFQPCKPEDASHLISTTELLIILGDKAKVALTDSSKMRLGKALRLGGFQRIKARQRYVYAVKETLPYFPKPQELDIEFNLN